MAALQLQALQAGAGIALVAADALQAAPLVRVAGAAAAPVEVGGEVVRALHVHIDLFCKRNVGVTLRQDGAGPGVAAGRDSPRSESERSEDTAEPTLSVRVRSTPSFSSCRFRCRCSRCSCSIWCTARRS